MKYVLRDFFKGHADRLFRACGKLLCEMRVLAQLFFEMFNHQPVLVRELGAKLLIQILDEKESPPRDEASIPGSSFS